MCYIRKAFTILMVVFLSFSAVAATRLVGNTASHGSTSYGPPEAAFCVLERHFEFPEIIQSFRPPTLVLPPKIDPCGVLW
jgi:hypothetical protein